jgi:hypothetical protein
MNICNSNTLVHGYLSSRHSVAALLLGSALMLPLAGVCGENAVHTAGTVTYVSGGVDDASLDALKANLQKYDLKLVFALKSGAFMSSVKVAISDDRGNAVLETTSDGPWFLASLPAGKYRVVSTSPSGVSITQQAAIEPAKLKTLDFRWTSE